MIKTILAQNPLLFRTAFALYALLVLWASLRTGGGPQPIDHFDKIMHFTFYAVFTVIAAGSTREKKTFIQLSLFIACYGVLMEFFQSFVPSRFMSVADIIANTSGIVIAVFAVLKLRIHNSLNH